MDKISNYVGFLNMTYISIDRRKKPALFCGTWEEANNFCVKKYTIIEDSVSI